MFRKIGKLIAEILQKGSALPRSAKEQEIKVTIKTETTHSYVDRLLAKGEILSLVDLDGYISPSGGFVNWATYEVSGKNINTNRKNKRRYDAKTEAEAVKQAETDGLIGPYDIVAIKHDDPTENQIKYLQSWGVSVPIGANKNDVSAILSRLEDSYNVVSEKKMSSNTIVQYIRPLPGPSEEFARYADDMGMKFSRYIGQNALFCHTIYSLNEREKAAFFAYCVLCAHYHKDIGDLRTFEYADQLYAFADMALTNGALVRSIGSRPTDDYIKPHKGSSAYKTVAEFFGLK